MKLIEHIVKNDRPFTEIVTADYIMVSPYTARGYGIYDEVKSQFQNPDDPFEYVPVKLKASSAATAVRISLRRPASIRTPGCSSTFQYLRRYPNTETNRNRLRARMYFQHFLGVDALELAARVADAAAVTAKYEIPTMQAAECVVCHKTLDPVAGLFQEYYKPRGRLWAAQGRLVQGHVRRGLRRRGPAGGGALAGAAMARRADGEGPALRDDDGRARLLHPDRAQGLAAAQGAGRSAVSRPSAALPAAAVRDRERSQPASRGELQLEERVQGLGASASSTGPTAWPRRSPTPSGGRNWTTSASCGCSPPSSSSGRSRRSSASPGAGWKGRWKCSTAASIRRKSPSGPPIPAARWARSSGSLANDVACKHTLRDFARQPRERLLFPGIEPDVVPGDSAEGDAAIRQAIVHLHALVLGRRRCRRLGRSRSHVRACSPASSKMPASRRAREAGELLTAGATRRTCPKIRNTRFAPGAAW